MKNEKYGLAYCLMEKCAKLAPDRPEVWNNIGLVAASLHLQQHAVQYLKKSLQLKPDQTEARNNIALVHVNDSMPLKGIEWADTSLAIKPGQQDVEETRGYACLLLKRWKEGWAGYERAINHSKYRQPKPMNGEPYWDGSPVNNLLIRGEQGIGDEIMFASCIPDAQKVANNITIECDTRLEGLLQRTFPRVKVRGTRQHKERFWRDEFDAQGLIGSLPHFYRNSDESFPGTPYLKTDPERVAQWKIILDKLPGLKVGLAWSGGLRNTFAARRSLSLSQLSPLFAVPGISWVSLQYKDSDLTAPVKIHEWKRATQAQDIDDVAALIDCLDLVITVTTTTAHIAGALGKPTWILTPEKPHWHYGLEGEMPWYNSWKIFRQHGKWDGVINELGEHLAAHIHRDRPPTADSLHSPAEQYHPASIEAGSNNPPRLKPTANFSGGANGIHVQPLSSPFAL